MLEDDEPPEPAAPLPGNGRHANASAEDQLLARGRQHVAHLEKTRQRLAHGVTCHHATPSTSTSTSTTTSTTTTTLEPGRQAWRWRAHSTALWCCRGSGATAISSGAACRAARSPRRPPRSRCLSSARWITLSSCSTGTARSPRDPAAPVPACSRHAPTGHGRMACARHLPALQRPRPRPLPLPLPLSLSLSLSSPLSPLPQALPLALLTMATLATGLTARTTGCANSARIQRSACPLPRSCARACTSSTRGASRYSPLTSQPQPQPQPQP